MPVMITGLLASLQSDTQAAIASLFGAGVYGTGLLIAPHAILSCDTGPKRKVMGTSINTGPIQRWLGATLYQLKKPLKPTRSSSYSNMKRMSNHARNLFGLCNSVSELGERFGNHDLVDGALEAVCVHIIWRLRARDAADGTLVSESGGKPRESI